LKIYFLCGSAAGDADRLGLSASLSLMVCGGRAAKNKPRGIV
jgi:hypothetical protein